MEPKKPWLSKTIWLGVATAIAPFIPGATAWLIDPNHLQTIGLLWGALAIVLRLVTKDRVSLTD